MIEQLINENSQIAALAEILIEKGIDKNKSKVTLYIGCLTMP